VPVDTFTIGLSTDDSVGMGWAEAYLPGDEPLRMIGSGVHGLEFGEPLVYVVAQTSGDVESVRAEFSYGGVDRMRPEHGIVVLTSPMKIANIADAYELGPGGRIEARDARGERILRTTIEVSAPTLPEECTGGLDDSYPAPTGDPPRDPAAATFEITSTYMTAYGPGLVNRERIELIEDGDALLEVMEVAAERNPDYRNRISAQVDAVRFVDASHAAVRFSLLIDDSPVTSGVGYAVLVDGRWLVARETYCNLLQLGGVWCPEVESDG
jgi:hypothetical protein